MNAKPRLSDEEEIDASSAPLIEHLRELRSRLIWSVLAFLVAMVISFTIWNPIFNFLTRPICHALETRQQDCGLILLKLQEGFFVAIQISFLGGFVLISFFGSTVILWGVALCMLLLSLCNAPARPWPPPTTITTSPRNRNWSRPSTRSTPRARAATASPS